MGFVFGGTLNPMEDSDGTVRDFPDPWERVFAWEAGEKVPVLSVSEGRNCYRTQLQVVFHGGSQDMEKPPHRTVPERALGLV